MRPLHPGLSIAQRDVTAGTLGGFVTVEGSDGLYVLSNNHVLANSDQAALDDPVLQPGPHDGGAAGDRVARLARAVHLDAGGGNTVDAAIALLEEVTDASGVDLTYPVGRLTGWADPDDEVDVEKVGRTTGWTKGRISAIELDDVAVQYPVGVVSFDGQIEVTGAERGVLRRRRLRVAGLPPRHPRGRRACSSRAASAAGTTAPGSRSATRSALCSAPSVRHWWCEPASPWHIEFRHGFGQDRRPRRQGPRPGPRRR